MKSKTNKNRTLYFRVGLALSLGVSLLAFEWKTYEPVSLQVFTSSDFDKDNEELPPITEYERPKPKTTPKLEVVKDDVVIEDTTKIVFIEFTDTATIIDQGPVVVDDDDDVVVEVADKVHDIVEENASPEGGMQNFYRFISKNLKYPRQAKRMGIEGKVFVKFIVSKSGELTNVEIIRGIGGGCDEEAVRIIKKSPRWNPGKQRGVPVKQRMTFPIHFKLK